MTEQHDGTERAHKANLDLMPKARMECANESARLWALLDRLTVKHREAAHVASVRCPIAGCELAAIYGMAIREGGERFVFRARTSTGKRKTGILNWAYPVDWYAPIFHVVGCRHGQVKLGCAWLLDVVSAVRGGRHALESEESWLASLPAEIAKGRRSKTFHPPGDSFRHER